MFSVLWNDEISSDAVEEEDRPATAPAPINQVTQDWAAQTEPSDWSEQVEWGGSNNW